MEEVSPVTGRGASINGCKLNVVTWPRQCGQALTKHLRQAQFMDN